MHTDGFAVQPIKRSERGHSCPRRGLRPTDGFAGQRMLWQWGGGRDRNRYRYRNRNRTFTQRPDTRRVRRVERKTRNQKPETKTICFRSRSRFRFRFRQPATFNSQPETVRPADASPTCGFCAGKMRAMGSKKISASLSKSDIHTTTRYLGSAEGREKDEKPETRNENQKPRPYVFDFDPDPDFDFDFDNPQPSTFNPQPFPHWTRFWVYSFRAFIFSGFSRTIFGNGRAGRGYRGV